MKRFLVVFLFLFLFVIGCTSTDPNEEKNKDPDIEEEKQYFINIDTLNFEIKKGESVDLVVSTNGSLKYQTSDENVAIVENEKVIAKNNGECNIIISSNENEAITKTIKVKVFSYITNIEITGEKEIYTGNTVVFTYSVDDDKAKKNIVWKTSDESVATINQQGELKGISEGKVIITVEDENSKVKDEIEITILKDYTKDAQNLLDAFVLSIPEETYMDLPVSEDEDYVITYELECFSETGVFSNPGVDKIVDGKVFLEYKGFKVSKDISIKINAADISDLIDIIKSQFPSIINEDLTITKRFADMYGGSYFTWESSNEECLDKYGRFIRPLHDESVTISLYVTTKQPEISRRLYTFDVVVEGQTIEYKTDMVKNIILGMYPENSILYEETVLPNVCEDYDAQIDWLDANGNVLIMKDWVQDPILGDTITLTAKISVRGESHNEIFDYRIWNKHYNNVWEKIDDFVNSLHQENVRSYNYPNEGYDETNAGYLPFYINENANILTSYTDPNTNITTQILLDYTYGNVRTGIVKTSTEYIVIHDTAGTSPTATALQHALGQVTDNKNPNKSPISWHFTVGTDGIFQSLPLDEVGYHAGDGSRVYGDIWGANNQNIGGGNRNGIGIESCVNHGADYNVTMRVLAKLVAELIMEYNLGFNRIKQHNAFTGKDCPGVIRHCGRWEEFLNLCKYEYFAKTELQDVNFEWTSLTPDLMDNTGKIINNDLGKALVVSYKVAVTLDGTTKEYSNSSNIQERYTIERGSWD